MLKSGFCHRQPPLPPKPSSWRWRGPVSQHIPPLLRRSPGTCGCSLRCPSCPGSSTPERTGDCEKRPRPHPRSREKHTLWVDTHAHSLFQYTEPLNSPTSLYIPVLFLNFRWCFHPALHLHYYLSEDILSLLQKNNTSNKKHPTQTNIVLVNSLLNTQVSPATVSVATLYDAKTGIIMYQFNLLHVSEQLIHK